MSLIPAATENHNVKVLQASERIQKLTMAANSLVARDFILSQEEEALDQLERYVEILEADVEDTEHLTAGLRARCALLQPGPRGAMAGVDAEVMALWRQHGASMARLLKLHSARLAELEDRLAVTADDDNDVPPALPAAAVSNGKRSDCNAPHTAGI